MSNSATKIVFMGTPYFADIALRSLISHGYQVVAAVTAPDRPAGRGGKVKESAVSITARDHRIKVLKPHTKDDLAVQLSEIEYDLIIVAAYGMIIPIDILDSAPLGCYNIHGSLLPKYRGASPIAAAILAGDKQTGVTIMKMSAGMDEGDIITSDKIDIASDDTTDSLVTKLSALGADLLVETLPSIIRQEIEAIPQNNEEATYCSLIQKSNGKISWNDQADQIERQVRAYNPWPSAFTEIRGKRIKILQSVVVDTDIILSPGKIKAQEGHLFIGCHSSSLEILTLHPEGKKLMSAKEFLNGNPDLINN